MIITHSAVAIVLVVLLVCYLFGAIPRSGGQPLYGPNWGWYGPSLGTILIVVLILWLLGII